MTKTIVKTAKTKDGESFMLIDNTTGEVVQPDRPSVVSKTAFVNQKVLDGVLIVLVPTLPKEANDKDFEKAYNESDENEELAVAAYASEYGYDTSGRRIPGEKGNQAAIQQAKADADKQNEHDTEERQKVLTAVGGDPEDAIDPNNPPPAVKEAEASKGKGKNKNN